MPRRDGRGVKSTEQDPRPTLSKSISTLWVELGQASGKKYTKNSVLAQEEE